MFLAQNLVLLKELDDIIIIDFKKSENEKKKNIELSSETKYI